ncbi:MAG: PspC domain-containing protein [Terriglobales bacterium]
MQRSRTDRKIAGVCAGFAHHLDLDPTVVRLIWLVLAFVGGGGVLAYVVAWIVIPEEPALVTTAATSPTI